ncbi:MAG: hypothetical protein SOZ79_06765, partial [Candidatus Ventricola sp.]|nr:hypothetical protein [Candidatus Ventricola sp.]
MRKITRRLTAAVLSACLALAPFGAFAESPQGITAQVVLPMQDGAQMALPVQTVVTSAGETVYWLDMSMLDEAQIEALSMGELILTNEAGELLGQFFFDGTEAAAEADGLVELYDAIDPGMSVPLMMAPMAMPESLEETEAVLAEYGFVSGEEYPEYVEEYPEVVEETPEYVEETPEYVEETPEYVEEYPEYVEESTQDSEEIPQQVEQPAYVTPLQDNTNLRSEPLVMDGNVVAQVNAGDVLVVFGYAVDGEGRVWWQAVDLRSGVTGCIMADVTEAVDESVYAAFAAQLEAERQAAEEPI